MHGEEPRRAVTEKTGEDHADHAASTVYRRGAKEGIDRRPSAVLAGPVHDSQSMLCEEEVPVWRGDVDSPALERHAVFGDDGRERSALTEDLTEERGGLGRRVLHNENRCRERRRELADECGERLDAAHRSTDDDDVPRVHRLARSLAPMAEWGSQFSRATRSQILSAIEFPVGSRSPPRIVDGKTLSPRHRTPGASTRRITGDRVNTRLLYLTIAMLGPTAAPAPHQVPAPQRAVPARPATPPCGPGLDIKNAATDSRCF